MKIMEWLLAALFWIAGALGLVLFGWMLRSYKVRRDLNEKEAD